MGGGMMSAAAAPGAEDVIEMLREEGLAELPAGVPAEGDLFAAGMDSMAVMQLIVIVEERYGAVIRPEDAGRENLGTPAALAAWALGIRNRPLLTRAECIPESLPRVSNFERVLALLFIAATACAAGLFNRLRYDGLRADGEFFVLLIGGMMGAALGWTAVAIAIRFRSRGRNFGRPAARFGQRG